MRASRVLAVLLLLLLGLTAMAAPVLAADATGRLYRITATTQDGIEDGIEESLYLIVMRKESLIVLGALDSSGLTWFYGVGKPTEERVTGEMFAAEPGPDEPSLGLFDLQLSDESVTGTMPTLFSPQVQVTGFRLF